MMNSNSITSKRENCNGINPINPFFIRLQESAGPLQCMVMWLETTSIRSALCLPVNIVASLRLQAQWISKSKAFRHLKKTQLSTHCPFDIIIHILYIGPTQLARPIRPPERPACPRYRVSPLHGCVIRFNTTRQPLFHVPCKSI